MLFYNRVCQRPPHTHPRDKGGGQSGREHRARHSTTERAALGRQRGPRRQSWRLQEVDSPIHQSRQACGALVQFLTPPCYSKSCKQFKNARVQLNQPAGRLRLLMRPDERGAGLRTCMRPVCLSVPSSELQLVPNWKPQCKPSSHCSSPRSLTSSSAAPHHALDRRIPGRVRRLSITPLAKTF
jgi:hypothetical protein